MNVTPPDAKSDGTLFRSVDRLVSIARGSIIRLYTPTLPAISSFLSSADDTIDSDTPDTPPSPTYDTPFTETTLSTQMSPAASGALRRREWLLTPRTSLFPFGRPYCYHLNGPVHMMTVRKRVGPLPTHQTSLDSPTDALSDSASSHSSSDHSLPASLSGMRSSHRLCSLVPSVHRSSTISERPSHDSSSASHSRKRSRSPVASVPLSSPTLRALEVGLGVDFEDESSEPSRSRGTNLVMDVDVVRSNGIEIDPKIQAEIDECFAYADALRDRGIDARVVVEVIDREESETGMRGPVKVHVTPRAIIVSYIRELLVREGLTVASEAPRSVESQTEKLINKQSDRQMAEALRVRNVVRNLRPLMGDEVEQEEVGGNGNGRNGYRGNGKWRDASWRKWNGGNGIWLLGTKENLAIS
ncbi:hypothetical protein Tco_0804596 [Tanacetum coccineum]|uniref:Uncharacterized protein n=1 Tax=Tanacetum coccineum TaxID=301880 RepID=A0ABQ5A944_9ASTR